MLVKKSARNFFLYRHRFGIGYAALVVVFLVLLCFLPSIAPGGLSDAEMNSAVAADALSPTSIVNGNVLDLPYLLLQKLSVSLFGLSLYSIKLPSIIFGLAAAIFIVLLLNRWFKSDVALVGSILTALSTAFLFLAGSGTPLIMYVFWLALILWLGSKIVNNKQPHPMLVISFIISIALSLYTPHLCYVALAIAIAGIIHPHLRFALKKLKIYQLVICVATFVALLLPLGLACLFHPALLKSLVSMQDFSPSAYLSSAANAFVPFFSFSLAYDSVYLAPLFGLASVALIFIGTLASIGKLFTSRNTVVSLLVIFAIFTSGLNPSVAIAIIVPIAILSAAGLESIIDKWHTLFPENPYAHFFGTVPIVVAILAIVISGLTHFIFGYHYTPRVAKNFSNDLVLINEKLESGTALIVKKDDPNFNFFKLLEKHNSLTVLSELPERSDVLIATLGEPNSSDALKLQRIVTSSKSRNSARLYIYEKVSN